MPAHRPKSNPAQAAEALESVLRESVVCRLESDVPLGCFLGGGTDSSLVAALAQQSLSGKLKTYTVGFQNSAMNEAPHARAVATHLGTNHHEIMVGQETLLAEFESILALAPEPIGDDSFVPTYLISRETRVQAHVEKDKGMYDAINRGLRRARGEVLAYLVRRAVSTGRAETRQRFLRSPSGGGHFVASAPRSARFLSPLLVLRFRLRRWRANHYQCQPHDYCIYTFDNPDCRKTCHVANPTFRWARPKVALV